MKASLETLLANSRLAPNDIAGRTLVSKAYEFAEQAHSGQLRASGAPYFTHAFFTAMIVARWQLDAPTIAAALLHDTLEDTNATEVELNKKFGPEVVFLVQGVTKISRIKYRGNTSQAETLKKMILALSEDIRVVFVKLADRTHNMQTLQYLRPEKQRRIAMETSEIYAPLAYRLGLGSVSGELDDLAFPYLYPEDYELLQELLKDHLSNGEIYMNKVREMTEDLLVNNGVQVIRVDSRAKRISSLYKKLKRYKMEITQIQDLIALRIIVPRVEDCYAALGALHAKWPPLPGKIKDYIALPKPNGYKSLHTTVICIDSKPTEFQIRTEGMHNENEYGIAAYWAYNEGKSSIEYAQNKTIFASARQLSWINQLKQWQQEMEDPDEFLSALKIDMFRDRIFCITPKGEAIDLPAGSTPVDFAYAIHSDIGDHCMGARVNNRMVPLDTTLESGDVVEIITQKNKKPNLSWLEFVKTRDARNSIRAHLRLSGVIPSPVKTSSVTITATDRIGLLKDVNTIFSQLKINISSQETVTSKDGNSTTIRIVTPAENSSKFSQLLLKLRSIPEIARVEEK